MKVSRAVKLNFLKSSYIRYDNAFLVRCNTRKKTSVHYNFVAVVDDIMTTTNLIKKIICRMLNDTEDRDSASSDPVSGIISASNNKKTLRFMLLQQQQQSVRVEKTTNQQLFFEATTV